MSEPGGDVTQLLTAFGAGDRDAAERLIPAVETALRRIARRHLRSERADHTLQTTELINEAYLKLIDQRNRRWENRVHFFSICARLMRRILVDHARKKKAAKRGGEARRVLLSDPIDPGSGRNTDIIDLDRALVELEESEPRQANVIELRFFGGLSIAEVAEIVGVSATTVKRDLSKAESWLYAKLTENGSD